MANRTQYTPGTPSWTDLTTTDQEAAKNFYGSLFGWTADDQPVGDGVFYSMMQLGGENVAAISPQPQQQREAGVPAAWNTYITVESADDALERAKGLGGTVHAPAFDVMDAGRMGVVQDPQGAYFLVWEPKRNPGASLVNAPGALSWNELVTTDMESSASFYGELFGWTATPVEDFGMPYMTIQNPDGRTNGGIRAASETEPCYWLVYFGSEDVQASLAQVSELGGNAIMGPMEIGEGMSLGAASDPQGAVFALYQGPYED
jgi:predicted enzyme related to lactoylglutathione lyase